MVASVWGRFLLLSCLAAWNIGGPGCGGKGGTGHPDGGTPDASGLPVGAACTASAECSGPSPDCIADRLAPLAPFESSENPVAQNLAATVVVPLPDGYCSNEAPCASDVDCGAEGRCFLPLIDVDEAEYAGLVNALGLEPDDATTLVGFREYGQCLRPCETAEDCTRPGYRCGVPLEDFLVLVEGIGARMETYCIGEPIDPCDPSPCTHGVCQPGGSTGFTCECDAGWVGALCDLPDPCAPSPCLHGTCQADAQGGFACDCEAGWTGTLCDAVDPCDPSPCLHGGTCAVEGGNATCTGCDPGWVGELCEVDDPCLPSPCLHGSCALQPDLTALCLCDSGWIGAACDVDDPCLPNPCLHGGACAVQGMAAACTGCDPGWSGTLCEVPYDCGHPGAVNAPLQVDVTSGTTLGSIATYSCDTGYVVNGTATRTCTSAGWNGSEPVCDPEPVVCESTTCSGHGTCVEVGGLFDHCDCDPGWTGPTCSGLVDCGAPAAAPANGNVAYTDTTYGASATYSCDTGYTLVGTATVTCQALGSWSGGAPTCTPVDCGAPAAAPANGSVAYTDTTYGASATYSCDTGYTLVGMAMVTCQASGSWSGGAPTCQASYCDVVYAFTGQFRVSDAPAACGNTTNVVVTNAANPALTGGATTPFTITSDFQRAYLRLRFPESGGDPVAGTVQLVEYYLPIEFVTSCTGTTVTTNVDHSVGLLAMSGTPPQIPASPTLSRPCQTWASGVLAGTTLDWSACDVVPPATGTGWDHTDAQAGVGDVTTACAMRMSVWGHVGCSGGFCFLVPGLGNQRNTWDQLLLNFAFSGTSYRTATFSMPEVQVPESTNEGNTRTWVSITTATPVHVECGVPAALTCDDE